MNTVGGIDGWQFQQEGIEGGGSLTNLLCFGSFLGAPSPRNDVPPIGMPQNDWRMDEEIHHDGLFSRSFQKRKNWGVRFGKWNSYYSLRFGPYCTLRTGLHETTHRILPIIMISNDKHEPKITIQESSPECSTVSARCASHTEALICASYR